MAKIGPGWEGFLTFENMTEAADAILAFLDGKTFAVATADYAIDPPLHVRTNMKLVRRKIEVKRTSEKWGCYIKIFTQGPGISSEEAWYVHTTKGYEVCATNAAYFEIGHSSIRSRQPRRFGSIEHMLIVIQ